MVRQDYLEVSGHAEYDEKGKDIVCASVSSLITGSAEIWKNSNFVKIIKHEDKFIFRFTWSEEESKNLKIEYYFLRKHLTLLSKTFPKNIKYIEELVN